MTVTISGSNGITGNGAGLTNLPAANLTGNVAAARIASTALPAANLTGNVASARLTSLPAANLTGTLPAISGVNLTAINPANLGSGTLPALNGSNLTALHAPNIVGALPAISGANLTGIGQASESATVAVQGANAKVLNGIPANVKMIHILLENQSFNGASNSTQFQFGTSSAIKTSGYVSYAKTFLEAAHTNQSSTVGFNFKSLAANEAMSGIGTWARRTNGSHIWVGNWSFGSTNGGNMSWGHGFVDLGAELTQIKIFDYQGGTSLDLGQMTVRWSY